MDLSAQTKWNGKKKAGLLGEIGNCYTNKVRPHRQSERIRHKKAANIVEEKKLFGCDEKEKEKSRAKREEAFLSQKEFGGMNSGIVP